MTNGTDHSATEPDERSCLLRADTSIEPDLAEATPAFPRRNLLLCASFILLLASLESGGRLQLVPLNQVLEDIICRRLYPDLDLASPGRGADCSNSEPVQAELALLRGWQNTLDLIPGVLTVVPYGFLADKYGRKFGLCLCVTGIVLASYFYVAVCWWSDIFPVRMTWLSSLFTLVGGGVAVLMSLLFSVLSDLAPDAYRSTTFFAVTASILGVELCISTLTPSLMHYNTWLPIFIGLALNIFSILLAFCLPETLKLSSLPEEPASHQETYNSRAEVENEQQDISRGHSTLLFRLSENIDKLRTAFIFFIRGNWRIVLLLLTILTTTLGKMAQEILLQFARKRFGWSWSKTGYLFALKASLVLLLLAVILPSVNYVLTKAVSMQPTQKDLNIARASCILLLLGNLAIGISATDTFMLFGVVVSSMGSAYDLILRSLLSQLVEAHHRAMLFTTVAMLECLGGIVAGPALAACFQVGLRLGGIWTGLPFLASGILFSLSLCALYSVRV